MWALRVEVVRSKIVPIHQFLNDSASDVFSILTNLKHFKPIWLPKE